MPDPIPEARAAAEEIWRRGWRQLSQAKIERIVRRHFAPLLAELEEWRSGKRIRGSHNPDVERYYKEDVDA